MRELLPYLFHSDTGLINHTEVLEACCKTFIQDLLKINYGQLSAAIPVNYCQSSPKSNKLWMKIITSFPHNVKVKSNSKSGQSIIPWSSCPQTYFLREQKGEVKNKNEERRQEAAKIFCMMNEHSVPRQPQQAEWPLLEVRKYYFSVLRPYLWVQNKSLFWCAYENTSALSSKQRIRTTRTAYRSLRLATVYWGSVHAN